MKDSLVEALADAERQRFEAVGVVADDDDPCADLRAVDLEPCPPLPGRDPEKRAKPPRALLLVDERRVGTERDVVQERAAVDATDVDAPLDPREGAQGPDRVAPVEPRIAREVVVGAERDADEGKVSLDRDGCHSRERTVPSGDAQSLRLCSVRQFRRVLARPDDVCANAQPLSLRAQLVYVRLCATGTRV